jgi:hypothetical protein
VTLTDSDDDSVRFDFGIRSLAGREPGDVWCLLEDDLLDAEPCGIFRAGETEYGDAVGDAGGGAGRDHLRTDLVV